MIEVYDPTIHENFTIQKCGIAPIGEPTYEQWLALGEFIKSADARIHFWIGDLPFERRRNRKNQTFLCIRVAHLERLGLVLLKW